MVDIVKLLATMKEKDKEKHALREWDKEDEDKIQYTDFIGRPLKRKISKLTDKQQYLRSLRGRR
jgi:hypothetical protein